MLKIAFVTGAAGFLGKYTCRALSNAGWQVHGIGFGQWPDNNYVQWGLSSWTEAAVDQANLLALHALAGSPHVVVHCAGGSSVGFSNAEPGTDFLWTVASLSSVLEYLRLHAPSARVVYPSSAAVYGVSNVEALSEALSPNPFSQYGVHKHLAEQLLASYASNFQIDTVAIRFFSLYGPGLAKQLLWDACKKLQNKTFSFGGTGSELRDFLYITDAADLILQCANAEVLEHKLVNAGTGIGTSVSQVLSLLAKAGGTSLVPQFSGESRAGDPTSLIADTELASLLGWKPRMALPDGMQSYMDWFLAENAPHG